MSVKQRVTASPSQYDTRMCCILVEATKDEEENMVQAKLKELVDIVISDEQLHRHSRDSRQRTLIYVNSDKVNRAITCGLGVKSLEVSLFTTDMLDEDYEIFQDEMSKWLDGEKRVAVCTIDIAEREIVPFAEHTIFFDFPLEEGKYVEFFKKSSEWSNREKKQFRMTSLFTTHENESSKVVAYSLMKKNNQSPPAWLSEYVANVFRINGGDEKKNDSSQKVNNNNKKSLDAIPARNNKKANEVPEEEGRFVTYEEYCEENPELEDPPSSGSDYDYELDDMERLQRDDSFSDD